MTQPDPVSAKQYVPAASTVAFVGAACFKVPQLQPFLAAHPGQASGDLLPYLLLAALCRWLAEQASGVREDDAETLAVVRLCGELFAMTFEHDPLGAAFASEIIQSVMDATRARAPTEL